MKAAISIEMLVPGGRLPTDHLHHKTNDQTCSRCRWTLEHGEVPLMLWINDGQGLLIYCETCLGIPQPAESRDDDGQSGAPMEQKQCRPAR